MPKLRELPALSITELSPPNCYWTRSQLGRRFLAKQRGWSCNVDFSQPASRAAVMHRVGCGWAWWVPRRITIHSPERGILLDGNMVIDAGELPVIDTASGVLVLELFFSMQLQTSGKQWFSRRGSWYNRRLKSHKRHIAAGSVFQPEKGKRKSRGKTKCEAKICGEYRNSQL